MGNGTGRRHAAEGARLKVAVPIAMMQMRVRIRQPIRTDLERKRPFAAGHESHRDGRAKQQYQQQYCARQRLPGFTESGDHIHERTIPQSGLFRIG